MSDIYNVCTGRKIEFTLRKLCYILGIDIPQILKEKELDKPIDVIS